MGQAIITRKGGGGGGSAIDELLSSFTVATGEIVTANTFVDYVQTLSMGTQATIESNEIDNPEAVLINTNKVLLVYRDYGSSSNGIAVVLTFAGGTITKNSEFVFLSGTAGKSALTKIENDKALLVYTNRTNNTLRTRVLSVSGSTISAGTDIQLASGLSDFHPTVDLIDTNKAIVAYTTSSNGETRTLTVSGTGVTAGTALVFQANFVEWVSVAKLDTNKAIVAYKWVNGSTNTSSAKVLSISGTTVTAGSLFNWQVALNILYIKVQQLSTNKVVLSYFDYQSTRYYGYAGIINVSGTTPTLDGITAFAVKETSQPHSMGVINQNKVLLTYRNEVSSVGNGLVVMLTIDGNNISVSNPEQVFIPFLTTSSTIALNNTNIMVIGRVYDSVANGWRAYAKVVTDSKTVKNATSEKVFGLAVSGGSAGSTVDVYVNE